MTKKKKSQHEIYRKLLEFQKGDEFRSSDEELIEYYGDLGRKHIELLKNDKSYRDTFNTYASQEMLDKETKWTLGLLSTEKDGAIKGGLKAIYYVVTALPTSISQNRRENKLVEKALGPEPM